MSRPRVLLSVLACVTLAATARPAAAAAPSPTIEIRETADGYDFVEDDVVVARYQRKPTSQNGKYQRAHYLHPLRGLDNAILTEDFPSDHLHHRGVFWAWHQLLVDSKPLGDAWACQRFHWDVVDAKPRQVEGRGELDLTVDWSADDLVDADGKRIAVVREQATIAVHPRGEKQRVIDIRFSLHALVDDVAIGGSDDAKGYGGFSVRMKLTEGMRFTTAAGEIEPIRTAIASGDWVNIVGPIGANGKPAGIVIQQREGTTGRPQPWILRRSGSMQNAAFPGRQPVKLSRDKPLPFSYRLIIHDGDWSG